MIDLAEALYTHREALETAQPRLRLLRELVARPQDLSPLDYSLFYTLALAFQPDCIVELGRGFGNSTCVFTQVANEIGGRVVSVDRDTGHTWETQTLPRLEASLDAAWFRPLEAMHADIMDVRASRMFGNARRVLLLWDAHGGELGRYVLGELLAHLQDREHLIILHDVADARWLNLDPAYLHGTGEERYWQGHFISTFEEIFAATDFLSRNNIVAESPINAVKHWLEAHEGEPAEALQRLFKETLGLPYEEAFYYGGFWLYFDLATRESLSPLAFPPVPQRTAYQRLTNRVRIAAPVDGLLRRLAGVRRSVLGAPES